MSCQSESGIVGSVQPRPQAISRYPSERRGLRTERDSGVDDRERGYVMWFICSLHKDCAILNQVHF